MAHYLITGGAGFIGSHLCDALLAQQQQVSILDNLSTGNLDYVSPQAHFIRGDIRDFELLKTLMADVDGCFHLAAIVSLPLCNEDWLTAHAVNVTGTLNVIKAAGTYAPNRIIPVVFASSSAVYGENQDLPLRETISVLPISIYGFTKLHSENYASTLSQLYPAAITALRLFNVFGPRQSANSQYSGVISLFAKQLLTNKSLVIYGSGEQTRDFIYVGDVIRFFMTAMEAARMNKEPSFQVYNVCNNRSTSINEIAQILSNLLQKQPEIIYQPARQGDILHSLGSNDTAEKILHLHPTTSLQQGLSQLVQINYKKSA